MSMSLSPISMQAEIIREHQFPKYCLFCMCWQPLGNVSEFPTYVSAVVSFCHLTSRPDVAHFSLSLFFFSLLFSSLSHSHPPPLVHTCRKVSWSSVVILQVRTWCILLLCHLLTESGKFFLKHGFKNSMLLTFIIIVYMEREHRIINMKYDEEQKYQTTNKQTIFEVGVIDAISLDPLLGLGT